MSPAPLPAELVSDRPVVAFDTEATGYSNVTDRPVELAGVRFRRAGGAWVQEDEFSSLVNPGVPIPPEAIGVHGITEDMVRGAPPPPAVLPDFFRFGEGAVWLAHYAPFDVGLLAFTAVREGIALPDAWAVDTFSLPKKLFPGLPNYALGTLSYHLRIADRVEHRALPDARATRSLFERCVERLGEAGRVSWAEVFAHAGPPLALADFAALARDLPPVHEALGAAIAAGRDVLLVYRGGSKGRTPRPVGPSHLFARDGHVYLEGYCRLDQEAKSYRLDRIESVAPAVRAEPTDATSS